MDNDDRIKVWRQQRRAGVLPTDPHATALNQASTRAAALVGEADGSIHPLLKVALDALKGIPERDPGERRALYDRLSGGVRAGIEQRGLSGASANFWTRRTGLIIRGLEADLRRDVDVFADGYAPEGLVEADLRLRTALRSHMRRERTEGLRHERRRATREGVAHAIPLPPDEAADVVVLRTLQDRLHAGQRPTDTYVPRVLTIIPLLVLRLNLIQADSKIALFWTFVGPVILMAVISSLYFVNGINYVMGMDVLTFTLTGSVPWIMFRMIVFRSSESYFGGRQFFSLEPITPLIMAFVNSTFYLVIYLFVLTVIVTIGHLIGIISLPNNIIGVLACIIGIALVAASFGLLFAGVASRWEYFMRFAPVIERSLQLFSSVFFVSEQLPEMYRKYILWWPLSHGFQLLRSCYFTVYKSTDASVSYFVISIILFVTAGLIADRLARSNIQPI